MSLAGASVLRPELRHVVRQGAYCDSIVLLKLQKSLAGLAGVEDASAVMATDTNLALLAANGLAPAGLIGLAPDDLLVVVRAESAAAGDAALSQLDALLSARAAGADAEEDYRPKSLAAALKALPEARWVLVSVPGRFAARVAREALEHGRHVFLFSDNVPLEEEAALKREAAERGLLLLGPDCGTAIVAGVGLGFANRVRRGGVGLVAASGTGLQAVASRLHALGAGVSQALGTGGRDLSEEIGGIAARQSLDLLARDPATRVIVLISKPPSPQVTPSLLAAARATSKPVVVCLLGYSPPTRQLDNLHFALNLTEAAELATELDAASDPKSLLSLQAAEMAAHLDSTSPAAPPPSSTTVLAAGGAGQGLPHGAEPPRRAPGGKDRRQDPRPSGERPSEGSPSGSSASESPASLPGPYLRSLFSGGTLAYEALLGLAPYLGPIHSNLHADLALPLADLHRGQRHTLLDLGDDTFTIGRLHPMIDQDLRLRRFRQEAADPEVGMILLDLVLGDAGHPDPAGEWVPVIEEAMAARPIEVVAMVVGTDDDPQSLTAQAGALRSAGATVFDDPSAAIAYAGARLAAAVSLPSLPAVTPEALAGPLAAVNVGLESFHDSLSAQGAAVLQVEWRPPAGGDPRLLAILDRLKGKPA